jgi:spore maturation protein CgeB
VEHPDEARHMGENGKKAVKEKYNWEGEGKKLLEIYKDLIRVK